jgi:hypothetical protein
MLGEVLPAAGRAKIIVRPNSDADSLGGAAGNATERRVRDACAAAGTEAPLVLDVVLAKGLEFSEVIIVDFFADLLDQAAWAAILKREDGLALLNLVPPNQQSSRSTVVRPL